MVDGKCDTGMMDTVVDVIRIPILKETLTGLLTMCEKKGNTKY
jgi:hypothetical protein